MDVNCRGVLRDGRGASSKGGKKGLVGSQSSS